MKVKPGDKGQHLGIGQVWGGGGFIPGLVVTYLRAGPYSSSFYLKLIWMTYQAIRPLL